MFRKLLNEAQAGDDVAACFAVSSARRSSAASAASPAGLGYPHTEFEGQVSLTKEEGGRGTPRSSMAIIHVYFRTTDVVIYEGTELAITSRSRASSSTPRIAMEEGLKLHPRGTVGSGRVTECS